MAGNEIFNDLNLVLQLNQHIECVTNATRLHSTAAPSGSLTKQTSFNVLSNLKSVSYSEPREDAQFDHQRSIFLSESSSDLPFHLQGDKGFNEASAMAKRRALRFSESIKTRIEFLWEVAGGKKRAEMAQRIRQQPEDEGQVRSRRGEQSVRRTAANDTKQLLPPLEQLDEEDYVSLMLLIFKVLRDDFVLELAHKQIQCDWEVDSHHGKSLSFDQFFAAVFELVDVWTCDVEEATYERFLHLLAKRITRRVAVFLDGAEIKLSLSDNFEPEVIVKAIPLRTIPKFASIARVVAAVGIRTVGELARADPKVIEQERVDFIQRNSGNIVPDGLNDIRKLSQDLQSLIAMFKTIALQFENLNYTLENNVLRRVRTAAGPHYFQPINNFHDLHNADSNVVNVLRSTFLIEKAISIQRQTEISAIRSELVKFGVELEAMLSDEAARDRYNALYDILVLRDGESIKALAAVMLEQIKLALSAHGITISDEEDPEEVYDGFYASVVTGTGDSIVQEAQRWIEETVQDNKVHEYIQHDFHELNSIDEVKLLGTEHGDEEFIALLAKDEDTEDEVVENTSKTGSRTNSSPIQRKSSQVAVLPKPPVPTSQENPSSSPIPMEEPLLHVPPEKVVAPVKHDTEHDAGEKKKKSKKKKSTHEKAIHTPVTPAPAPAPPQPKAHTPVPSAPAQSPIPTEKSHQPDPSGDRKEKPIAPRRKPKLTISTQFTPAVTKPIDEIASLGPPVEATSCATPDDGKRNKPTLSPRIGHSKAEIEIDAAQADKTLHDSSEQHTARDALNVAIEFEEDDSAPGASSAKVDGERCVMNKPHTLGGTNC
ncbi:hypothetical protein PHMEG_00019489 [Phytophthora megakarya]|uniref:Uncharacterized protein n=1 Tax=Phytophthora megakarya TaxID=4795 RepID=A0A225VRS5_9STRA|nr:hypothetical protein PHMEG_00019489 [Phytophthora megakarya]